MNTTSSWSPEPELSMATVPRALEARPGSWVERVSPFAPIVLVMALLGFFGPTLNIVFAAFAIVTFLPAVLVAVGLPWYKRMRIRRLLQGGVVVGAHVDRIGPSARGHHEISLSFDWKGQQRMSSLVLKEIPASVEAGRVLTCFVDENDPDHIVIYETTPYRVKNK